MKFLKFSIISISILIALYVILSLFGPVKFEVSQSVVVNTSTEKAYNYIIDFNSWSDWSPWDLEDSTMTKTITGSGLGAKMEWESSLKGNGSQEIIEIEINKKIVNKLIIEDWQGDKYLKFIFEEVEFGTKITWEMDGGTIPLLGRGMMIFYDFKSVIDDNYKKGLTKIKEVLENFVIEKSIDISRSISPKIDFLGIRKTESNGQIRAGLIQAELHEELSVFCDEKEINVTGNPFAYFYTQNTDEKESNDMMYGFQVDHFDFKIQEGLTFGTLKQDYCLSATHLGSYINIYDTYSAIETYAKEHGINLSDESIEVYENNLTLVNEDKIETSIYWKIKE